MRTFRLTGRVFPVIISLALLAPVASQKTLASPEKISTGPTGISPTYPAAPKIKPTHQLAELRSKLDHQDHLIALRALHLALTQVPDGGAYIWKRKSRALQGVIKPSKPFRNAQGQICRHVIYALALGKFIKQIKGIACRQDDGSWHL